MQCPMYEEGYEVIENNSKYNFQNDDATTTTTSGGYILILNGTVVAAAAIIVASHDGLFYIKWKYGYDVIIIAFYHSVSYFDKLHTEYTKPITYQGLIHWSTIEYG